MYSQEVKTRAYELDPECWVSYSGKPKAFKQYMDARREESLKRAFKEEQAEMARKPPKVDLENSRTVTFKREVLVTNPRNKFENQRFGIELSDERGAGESYATVYGRLKAAGIGILRQDVKAYLDSVNAADQRRKLRLLEVDEHYVAEQYNLF